MTPARAPRDEFPILRWRCTEEGAWTEADPAWHGLTRQSPEASRGFGWLDAVHPEDREDIRHRWLAVTGDTFRADYRVHDAAGDRYRWYRSAASREGAVGPWSGVSVPVEDLMEGLARRRLALEELRHRLRNILGVTRSIIRRTMRDGGTAEDYAADIDARMGALTRLQAAALRDPLAGVDLAQMLADEFSSWALREGDQVSMEGPTIRLRGKAFETLGLMMHELTADAVKRGVFSAPSGRLWIGWTAAEAGTRVTITWREAGNVATAAAAASPPFATEMLERQLPYELRAVTGRRPLPGGQEVVIDLPVEGDISVETTGSRQS